MTDPQEPRWMRSMPEAARARVREGSSRLDPRRIGCMVGVIGGIVFATDYSNVSAMPWRAIVIAVAWLLAVATAAVLFWRPRPLGMPGSLANRAWLVYLASVVGMLAVIAVGRLLLTQSGHADAAPSLIAAAVGAHFLPFARAFREPHFTRLGIVLVVIGVVGLVLAIVVNGMLGSLAAVVAGIVMLGMQLRWALRRR